MGFEDISKTEHGISVGAGGIGRSLQGDRRQVSADRLRYGWGSASSGQHDNCVMALAMAWQVTNVSCIRMATCGRTCSDACSKMNGLPAVVIPHFATLLSPLRGIYGGAGRAGDPIEEIENYADKFSLDLFSSDPNNLS